ncbi:MAG: hypothetical protein ABSG89_04380 [Bacteroidales bacterium]
MKNILQVVKFRYLKSILLVFSLLLTIRVTAPGFKFAFVSTPEPIYPYERLIKAIVQVESKGDTMACNLVEEAFGAFQIRPIRLQDYNQRTGNNYKMTDCYNYQISKRIFLFYATRFMDYESVARSWNGSGENTLVYWDKVKSYL